MKFQFFGKAKAQAATIQALQEKLARQDTLLKLLEKQIRKDAKELLKMTLTISDLKIELMQAKTGKEPVNETLD